MTDDGFREIQLSGKQLVFLFMTATVVLVGVFLCGVLVGRGVQMQRATRAESSAVEMPVAPPEAVPAAAAGRAGTPAGDTLTYPQRLQGETPVPETIKPAPAPPPVAADEPPEPAPATPEAGWVVQVAALRDRDAAMAIVKRLQDKKYPAFLLEPAPGAPAPVYRVRVGRYTDRAEADRISRRLEREEQFKPLITR